MSKMRINHNSKFLFYNLERKNFFEFNLKDLIDSKDFKELGREFHIRGPLHTIDFPQMSYALVDMGY